MFQFLDNGDRRLRKIGNSQTWLFSTLLVVITTVSVVDFLYASTRLRRLSPDGLNYLTVARNIRNGHGITQSAIGFNDGRDLGTLDAGHQALTAQPPLYPILTASLSWLGIDIETAGLLVTRLGFLVAVVAATRLALDIGGTRVCGWLAAALLIWNPVLRDSALRPQSDALGAGLLMAGLSWLFVHKGATGSAHGFAIGLVLGGAFATRYVLGVLLVVALHRFRRTGLLRIAALAAGFFVPCGLVLVRNIVVTGHALGAARLPSDRSWQQNLVDAAVALAARGPGDSDAFWTTVSLLIIGLAFIRASSVGWMPFEWPASYISVLVILRSMSHFAPLDGRLLLPASVPLLVVGATTLRRIPVGFGVVAFFISGTFAVARGVEDYVTTEPSSARKDIRSSEKLIWVRDVPRPHDLLIGDDSVDLGYFFDRTVVSVSPFPYTERIDWPEACAMAARWQRSRPDASSYVVMNRRPWSPGRWGQALGPLFESLANGDRRNVEVVARLSDAWIYRLNCPS